METFNDNTTNPENIKDEYGVRRYDDLWYLSNIKIGKDDRYFIMFEGRKIRPNKKIHDILTLGNLDKLKHYLVRFIAEGSKEYYNPLIDMAERILSGIDPKNKNLHAKLINIAIKEGRINASPYSNKARTDNYTDLSTYDDQLIKDYGYNVIFKPNEIEVNINKPRYTRTAVSCFLNEHFLGEKFNIVDSPNNEKEAIIVEKKYRLEKYFDNLYKCKGYLTQGMYKMYRMVKDFFKPILCLYIGKNEIIIPVELDNIIRSGDREYVIDKVSEYILDHKENDTPTRYFLTQLLAGLVKEEVVF